MPDLQWDEVKSFFYPDLMGAFPDVYVPDASAEDWQPPKCSFARPMPNWWS
ncbi:hypothetical protein ACFWIW_05100 [Amycolatopsis sp. NPDC058340]|uniref:hypothetical protein n=1 Tax=Amycolatopsis sp. NPDC058340 TaxID=3346453 RepID=UPI00364C58A5